MNADMDWEMEMEAERSRRARRTEAALEDILGRLGALNEDLLESGQYGLADAVQKALGTILGAKEEQEAWDE